MQLTSNIPCKTNLVAPNTPTPKAAINSPHLSHNQDGFTSLNKPSIGNKPRFGMLKPFKTLLRKTSGQLNEMFTSQYSSKKNPYAAIYDGWNTYGAFNAVIGCALIESPVVRRIQAGLCDRVSLKDKGGDVAQFKQTIKDSIAQYQQGLQTTGASDDHFAALYLKCGKLNQEFAKQIENEFNNYAANVYVRAPLLEENNHKLICLITKPTVNAKNLVNQLEPAGISENRVRDLEKQYKNWKKESTSEDTLYAGLDDREKAVMKLISEAQEVSKGS